VVTRTALYLTIPEVDKMKNDIQLISINKTRSIILVQLNWDFGWYYNRKILKNEVICFKNILGGI